MISGCCLHLIRLSIFSERSGTWLDLLLFRVKSYTLLEDGKIRLPDANDGNGSQPVKAAQEAFKR